MKKVYFYGEIKENTTAPFSKYKIMKKNKFYLSGYWQSSYDDDEIVDFARRIDEMFYWEVSSVEFEVGWNLKIGKEILRIQKIVHRLDGSVEYYTNKFIKSIEVNSEDIIKESESE